MEISSSAVTFRISMVDLDELKPHEEVVDSIVESLVDEVSSQGQLRDPPIVDKKDFVVLDGSHRFNALKLLRCRFIPCCLVDYDSPQIKVGSWFRFFKVTEPESLAQKLLTESELDYSKQYLDPAGVRYDSRSIILIKNGATFSYHDPIDPVEHVRTAVRLEKSMVKKGYTVSYVPEIVAVQRLKSGEMNFMIPISIFTKQQIREFGVKGQLLPHKVTRHVVPSRPLGINVPLPLLMDRFISREEAEGKLSELLAARRIEKKPPGFVVDGRQYEEDLLVFSA